MRILLLAACLLAAPAWAQDHDHHLHSAGKHEHGLSQLSLAQDGEQILLTLDSPAVNLLGFEKAPHSTAEKAKLKTVLQTLQTADKLLQLNPEAGCQLHRAEVQAPWSQPQAAGEHADFTASYSYQCRAPQALKRLDAKPLLQAYPGIKTLELEWALPRQQGRAMLTAKKSTAALGR